MEEDIKILESLKKYLQNEIDYGEYKIICGEETIKTDDCINALENLLKEYKRVKAGRDWYFEHTVKELATPEMLDKVLRQEYIPISVIQNKIDELLEWEYDDNFDINLTVKMKVELLQELLEERNK